MTKTDKNGAKQYYQEVDTDTKSTITKYFPGKSEPNTRNQNTFVTLAVLSYRAYNQLC